MARAARRRRRHERNNQQMRPLPALLASLAAVAFVAACGVGVPSVDLPKPPTTLKSAAQTTLPDTSDVELAAIPGRTTTVVPPIGPGSSRVTGTVTGPEGPVPGAVVRLERFVGDVYTRLDVTTGPDGRYVADRILGGRYRARAFRPPDLTLDRPVIFFLGDAKNQPLDFALTRKGGTNVRAAIAPNPPLVDQPANITVAVSGVVVDKDGIVRRDPVTTTATALSVPSDWSVLTPNPVNTDSSGRASWQVECLSVGSAGVSVSIGTEVFQLDVPACSAPPPATTTTLPPTSTTSPSGPTATTTRDRKGGPKP